MKLNTSGKLLFVMSGLLSVGSVFAAPTVTRLTPPSALFHVWTSVGLVPRGRRRIVGSSPKVTDVSPR